MNESHEQPTMQSTHSTQSMRHDRHGRGGRSGMHVWVVLLLGGVGVYAYSVQHTMAPSTLACTADSACDAREICVDHGCRAIERSVSACSNAEVRFPPQSADVETAGIERILRCLHADRAVTLTLTGSRNSALSSERAHAVAEELMARGASPVELQTVHYGADRRLCDSRDTRCPD